MDINEARKELAKYEYGQLVNIKKYLELEYSRAETLKDAMLEGLKDSKFNKDKELAEETLEELYKVLQRIENRATLVERLKVEKEVRH